MLHNPLSPAIAGIIVAYHPKHDQLERIIKSIEHQVSAVIIIDNTPCSKITTELFTSQFQGLFHYFKIGSNMGIGYAQNLGVLWALEQHMEYVLFLDQDSIPNHDMVQKLQDSFLKTKTLLPNLIAAGPCYFDPRSKLNSQFLVSKFKIPYRYKRKSNGVCDNIVLASFFISSGSLIDLKGLQAIGGMRSDYFIDHVDTEWCLRALAKGYKLVGVHDAQMQHALGDRVHTFWLFGSRKISEHSPLRDYYMFRNTLLLLNDVSMPLMWKIFLILRLPGYFCIFILFAGERKLRARMMLLGILHGMMKVRGKLDLQKLHCNPIPITPLDPNPKKISD